jgi:hypothetical protein
MRGNGGEKMKNKKLLKVTVVLVVDDDVRNTYHELGLKDNLGPYTRLFLNETQIISWDEEVLFFDA